MGDYILDFYCDKLKL
ncbi:hypothetical protein IKO50_03540 [bacterium]|nr:hypothetical protein [bacterium]MBR4634014.1 hypothetical protein [bacterium]